MPVRTSGASPAHVTSGGSQTDSRPAHLTYEEGAILTLRANDLANRLLTVRLLRLYHPFSFSCVMKVEILHGLSKSDRVNQRAVLKLYDRRFAAQLRKEHGVAGWSPRCEDHFLDFANSSEGTAFQNMLQRSDSVVEPEVGWDQAQKEMYLQLWCSDMVSTEIDVYQHLKELQGKQIPKLFSSVAISVRKPSAYTAPVSAASSSLLQVRGLLMEDVVGPTLAQMPDFIPPQFWQALFDKAVRVLGTLSDRGVVNEDVRAANVIVGSTSEGNSQHRIVVVDFAQCSIRPKYLSDSEWERIKREQDQEGALFRTMSAVLKNVGFDLQHATSTRSADKAKR